MMFLCVVNQSIIVMRNRVGVDVDVSGGLSG